MTTCKLGKKDEEPKDIMVSKFQEAMSKFHSLEDQIKLLVASNQELNNKLGMHAVNSNRLSSMLDEQKSTISSLSLAHEKNKGSYEVKHSHILESIKQHEGISQGLSNGCSSIVDRLNSLESKVNQLTSVNENNEVNYKSLITQHDRLVEKVENSDKKSKELELNVSIIGQVVSTINVNLFELSEACKNLSNKSIYFCDELSKKHQNVLDTIQSVQANVPVLISKAMDKINIPCIQGLAKSEDLDKFSHEFQKAALDARNSLLRSSNNEAKITILEKKLEQAQLLINKIQLGG